MQPAEDDKSMKADAHLDSTGECHFYLDLNGARLKPISYGLLACTDMERKFHSCVGEAASGKCAIGQNRKYLLGCHFY